MREGKIIPIFQGHPFKRFFLYYEGNLVYYLPENKRFPSLKTIPTIVTLLHAEKLKKNLQYLQPQCLLLSVWLEGNLQCVFLPESSFDIDNYSQII